MFDPRTDDAVEQLREVAPEGLDAALAPARGHVLGRIVLHTREEG